MASELQRLVNELRAIATEADRLRPRLSRHAGVVRQFAAEVSAAPDGRSVAGNQAVALLHLASRQCDALSAELAHAKLAADHFADRVLGAGGPTTSATSAPPAGAPVADPSDAAPAGERRTSVDSAPAVGAAAGVVPAAGAEVADEATPPDEGTLPGGAARPDSPATGGEAGSNPYVPWWIPNGAPWLGRRGIAPRRDADGKPLTRFSPADLTKPEVAGTTRRGGHGGADVPPARVPIGDPSRDLVTAFVDAGYTSPNCLPPGLVAERCFWMDQGGHPVLRHAEIPHSTLINRVLSGRDPISDSTTDWETGNTHKYGRDATTFTSRAALIFAEARIWESAEATASRNAAGPDGLSFKVRVAASDVLGEDFRRHVAGWTLVGTKTNPAGAAPIDFPADTSIIAVYRNSDTGWNLYTMYPDRSSST